MISSLPTTNHVQQLPAWINHSSAAPCSANVKFVEEPLPVSQHTSVIIAQRPASLDPTLIRTDWLISSKTCSQSRRPGRLTLDVSRSSTTRPFRHVDSKTWWRIRTKRHRRQRHRRRWESSGCIAGRANVQIGAFGGSVLAALGEEFGLGRLWRGLKE